MALSYLDPFWRCSGSDIEDRDVRTMILQIPQVTSSVLWGVSWYSWENFCEQNQQACLLVSQILCVLQLQYIATSVHT